MSTTPQTNRFLNVTASSPLSAVFNTPTTPSATSSVSFLPSVPETFVAQSDKVFSIDNATFSMDNKVSATYVWFVGDFHHFYKNPTHCTTVWSKAFYSPSMANNLRLNQNNNHTSTTSNSTITSSLTATQNIIEDDTNTMMIDNPLDNADEQDYHTWRLCLFPHGYKTDQHISLFLYAFQTDSEKKNGILMRPVKYSFELFKLVTNPIPKLQSLNVTQTIFKKDFNLDQKGDSGGKAKFCELSNIFPDNDVTVKTDIVIKVQFVIEDFSDVKFSFSNELEIKASRLALSARSSYFDKMFSGEWADTKSATIPIKDVSYQCFKLIIYYLYTGDLKNDLPFDVLKDLCVVTESRGISELSELVSSRIINKVNYDNWSDALLIGRKTKNNHLKNVALKFINEHWENVREDQKFRDIMSIGDFELGEEIFHARYFGVVS
ncbi:10222_t:CDS:2 [Entrophospora sp. SA101]|nr:10217_t:CDS:2 [Entrophospora sp. SA101]CAJ0626139.1 10222_t:CDS:2 [Entrophospora sp. SA101]CAJ0846768.1 428_t:CDS:2 [Entrophospora sp. SA101]CAJ0856856.1 6608_t:CDS:2 [Entrophospora sp. SA101]